MEYLVGTRLDEIRESMNEAAIERALILSILEAEFPETYKKKLEELRKKAK